MSCSICRDSLFIFTELKQPQIPQTLHSKLRPRAVKVLRALKWSQCTEPGFWACGVRSIKDVGKSTGIPNHQPVELLRS